MPTSLEDLVDEVVRLRFEETLPPSTATPSEVLESLRRTRQRLDRVEEILARVLRLKGSKAREHLSVKADADEKWDAQVVKVNERNQRVRGNDFVAPRERYADANLATFNEQRAALAAELAYKRVEEAERVIRQSHHGLDTLRQDHSTILRTIVVENSLDR